MAGQEVNVVDDQQIDVPESEAELLHVADLDGIDELVDEVVAGKIQNARIRLPLQHFLANRLKKMGLAKPHAAVNKQRVVSLARLFGDGNAAGMGKLVAWAGDELVKGIVRTKGERLIALAENSTAAKVVAMK